ncbi:putative GATA-binding transcription factor [Heterostelium album PN500]|uniref:Putative GATA-binding transcription factor n=1 Tax=Heterostelium pallidum (strain ATCC 26659 / Pp 5 / PN500) TaxID=670386 RepID=D3BMK9_HETP5|nr:putative GATA-binding transcription factor [Heterostelium album PN500]EFA77221.1 putative GATA-binding transcription factor [Heterostelium album PN500]|eukprot:XP_020429350.1 putative GATA-binding transcription factor [Heterostelium album PN500]
MEKYMIASPQPQSSASLSFSPISPSNNGLVGHKPYSLNYLADSAVNLSNNNLNYKYLSNPNSNNNFNPMISNNNNLNYSSNTIYQQQQHQQQQPHHQQHHHQQQPQSNPQNNNLSKSPNLLYSISNNNDHYLLTKSSSGGHIANPYSSTIIPTVPNCNGQVNQPHPNQVPSLSPCGSPQSSFKSLATIANSSSSHFSPTTSSSSLVPCLSKSRSNSIDSDILIGNSLHSTPVMPPALHISSSPMHHGQVPPQVHLFNYSPSSSPIPYYSSGQLCPVSPPFGLNSHNGSATNGNHHHTPLNSSAPSVLVGHHQHDHKQNEDTSSSPTPPSIIDSGAILECFIELRDLGSSISKQSKESMVNGDFYNGLERIKQTLSTLINKVDSLDGSMQNFIQNGGDSRIFGNNDEGRVPVLTRPRRFRKSKVKNKENSSDSLDLLDPSKQKRKSTELKHCTSCGTTSSPEWRKGPAGNQSLCNACGLYFAKLVRREASLAWKPQSVVKVNDLLCVGNNAANNNNNNNNPNGNNLNNNHQQQQQSNNNTQNNHIDSQLIISNLQK